MTTDRQIWMGLLARADPGLLVQLCDAAGLVSAPVTLRAPEIGTAMVRGRAGATGALFNLGEITVTRCAVQLACGTVGHGYVQGRDRRHATLAATLDAAMQGADAAKWRAAVLDPLADAAQTARTARAERAAATKVDFFTLVRGEDA